MSPNLASITGGVQLTESGEKQTSEYETGESVDPRELHVQFEIPLEEITCYRDNIRIYSQGGVIIREGDQEQALYLLRAGTVEVFKGSGASREPMSKIEAGNIFGEMSMINDEPRSATVTAATNNVMVHESPPPTFTRSSPTRCGANC